MKQIELQCDECGGKEITLIEVSPEDKAAIASYIDHSGAFSDQELAMYADELQRGPYPNTHVVCQTCGYLIPTFRGWLHDQA